MFTKLKAKLDTLVKSDEEIRNKFKDVEFEKHDGLAMFIAALITFVPAILVILGILYLIIWLLFLI